MYKWLFFGIIVCFGFFGYLFVIGGNLVRFELIVECYLLIEWYDGLMYVIVV